MDVNDLIFKINSCKDCKSCLEVCDTYKVTNDLLKSPNGRLQIAKKVFSGDKISEEERISLYTCTLCGLCDLTCQQEIEISEIIHSAKIKLVEQNKAPLEIHNKIIKGIVEKENSVGGTPEERLDWLLEQYRKDEIFEQKESDTLLFFGCMSSFRINESASAPYEILKLANYNFKILEKEPCCGEYVYSAGKLDLAKKIFKENIELFKKIGVKTLIITCGGCLYAFDKVYPQYFEDFNVNVRHIVDVIYNLEKEGKIKLNPLNKTITYHDPCRLGRKYKSGPLFEEPRDLLKKCGLTVNDITDDPKDTPCCGAGSGIRGVDSNICIKIGKELFDQIETKEIVSSCPLCVFNFRYVNFKNQMDKEAKYITDYVLESMHK
ncbi:MAG: (Fe-S)-binding protein [Candidatus Lokiarchaeota archaeon]|nr:(Fe-S)-binding protein [Candidatus Lokiarchaeota archaeon]